MPLEAAQILCTTIYIDKFLGYVPRALNADEREVLNKLKAEIKHLPLEERPFPYLPMMYNHPCTIWARESLDNHEWVHCYANALNDEYHYRYGKLHKSIEQVVNKLPDPVNLERVGFTKFGLAMPEDLRDYDNPIQSYRDYYHLDKATFASWKYRDKPHWWNEDYADYEKRITRV